jgi:hypothetical protein
MAGAHDPVARGEAFGDLDPARRRDPGLHGSAHQRVRADEIHERAGVGRSDRGGGNREHAFALVQGELDAGEEAGSHVHARGGPAERDLDRDEPARSVRAREDAPDPPADPGVRIGIELHAHPPAGREMDDVELRDAHPHDEQRVLGDLEQGVVGGDRAPSLHPLGGHHPRDRRRDAAEREPRAPQLDVGLCDLVCGARGIELGGGSQLACAQPLRAMEDGLGVRQDRLGPLELSGCFARVQLGQGLADPDAVPFLHEHSQHGP